MKFPLSFLALLLCLPSVLADMAPLVSHTKELGNKKYLLVILYPKENTLNKENPLNTLYPSSGLYRNDGSHKPIWTLADPLEGEIFLSADGNSLANVVFPAERKGDGVRIFHKGKLLRAYKVEELARSGSIREACPSCIWHRKTEFNKENETFLLESNDGRVWHFDLKSGEAVVQSGALTSLLGSWWIGGIVGVMLTALLVGGILLVGFLFRKSARRGTV